MIIAFVTGDGPEFIAFIFLVVFECIDFADFTLRCNDIWHWGSIPVSWNTAGTFFVLISIVYGYFKYQR